VARRWREGGGRRKEGHEVRDTYTGYGGPFFVGRAPESRAATLQRAHEPGAGEDRRDHRPLLHLPGHPATHVPLVPGVREHGPGDGRQLGARPRAFRGPRRPAGEARGRRSLRLPREQHRGVREGRARGLHHQRTLYTGRAATGKPLTSHLSSAWTLYGLTTSNWKQKKTKKKKLRAFKCTLASATKSDKISFRHLYLYVWPRLKTLKIYNSLLNEINVEM
jgi:hypothetical protein